MSSIRVGVLRGGISSEHEVSLKTGESVLNNMPEKYSVKDIFINKEGDWHLDGKPAYHERIFRHIDVVFNALHGEYGEDGKVQGLFEAYGIPYTGSGVISSSVGMNKILARQAFKKAGLKIPRGIELSSEEGLLNAAEKIFRNIAPPWVIKYPSGGSSVGIFIARAFDDLANALESGFSMGNRILAEEYISGREATCGVIDDFRNEKHYALPVIEIIPPSRSGFFNYDAKYGGETKELCPSNFDLSVKKEIEAMAKLAHISIWARHYSRSDFIVSKKGIYLLEINTLPGLTRESLLPKAVNAVGSSYGELLEHLINLALSKK